MFQPLLFSFKLTGVSISLFLPPGAFFLYSGLSVLGLLFVMGCLPETQGRRLEEMEALFSGNLCSCSASDRDGDGSRNILYNRVKGSDILSDNDASDME